MFTRYQRFFRELDALGCRVEDLNVEGAELMFLLESPHTDELEHGVPLAGESGVTVSKHLLDMDTPFGLLVQEGRLPEVRKVGIMNVCQVPLQKYPYERWKPDVRQQHGLLLTELEAVRNQFYRQDYEYESGHVIEQLLLKDLERRLRRLKDRKIIWVPCGLFASTFLKRAEVWGRRWSKIDADAIERVTAAFRRLS